MPEQLAASDDFAEVFRFSYPRLVRALRLAGADRTEAEDVAQEAFARTFAHWRHVRSGTNPPGYAYRVAFRLLHKQGRFPVSPLDDHAGNDAGVDTRIDLERALEVMPPRRRACAVLCWLLEASPSEAADVLGIAAGTVRKQLEMARKQLRA